MYKYVVLTDTTVYTETLIMWLLYINVGTNDNVIHIMIKHTL